MKNLWTAHQGDVFIRHVEKIPVTAKKVVTNDRLILAAGEQTGHHHAIHRGAVMFRADEGQGTWIQVADTADVVHEEHAKITLPAGLYEIVIQSQYTPQEIRNVAD